MKRSHVWYAITMSVAFAWVSPAMAQQVVSSGADAVTRAKAPDTFAKTVTLSLAGVSLVEAIDRVGKAAGIRVQYRADVLETVRKQITLTVRDASLREVFTQILIGTELEAVSPVSQVVTVQRMPGNDTRTVQGTIIGKVLHAKSKQPLAGATVTLGEASQGVVSGTDGTFRLTAAAGEHVVYIKAVGFGRQRRVVTVVEGQALALEVLLEPSASVLDEVVVTGTVVATERKAITTPITVITAEEIERRGITNIEQFFRGEVPGVVALERGSQVYDGGFAENQLGSMVRSNVYVRGSSQIVAGATNPLKTYIDGVELLDPALLGTIDPNSIERIEIIAGPQAATVYGSGAMGGVMQIFTKKGNARNRPSVTANLKYGILESNLNDGRTPRHQHTVNATGGASAEFTYSGNVSYGYTGQWQPGLWNRMLGVSLGAAHTRKTVTANASVSVSTGKNGAIDGGLAGDLPWSQARVRSGEFVATTGQQGNSRVGSNSNQTISLQINYRPSSFWQHALNIGRSQNTFDSQDETPNRREPGDSMFKAATTSGTSTTAGYNINFITPRPARISSTLALGLNGSWGDQTYMRGCVPAKSSTSFISCTSGFVSLNASRSVSRQSWGGFGSWQLGLFNHFYATLGLRGERNPSYGNAHKIDWTPSNGVAYNMNVGELSIKFLGSYGRATRPPAPSMRLEQLSPIVGYFEPAVFIEQLSAPDLTPEYSRGPQGGLEFYYGNVGSLAINHYSQKVTDLIQRVRVDSVPVIVVAANLQLWQPQYRYLNTASIQQHGWDATGSLNLWWLTFKGTYSWSSSRILAVHPTLANNAYWHAGQGNFGTPTHTGNVTVSYAHGGTSVVMTNSIIGSYARFDGSTVTGLYATYARLKGYLDRQASNSAYVLPGYVKSNIAISQNVRPWVSLTMNVDNLTNSYQSDANLINAILGRQVLIGVQLRPALR